MTRPKSPAVADDLLAPALPVYRWQQALRRDERVRRHLLLVLLVAGGYADAKTGRNLRPGALRLAEDTGLGASTVRHHLAAAEALGYLLLVLRGGRSGDGRRRANQYACTLPPGTGSTDGPGDAEDRGSLPLEKDPSTAETESLYRPPDGGHLLTFTGTFLHRDLPARLPGADAHAGAAGSGGRADRPPWCGTCDEATRQRNRTSFDPNDRGGMPYRCPACHPEPGRR